MSPRPAIDHVRKPQILDAAAAVIAERGLVNTRIADVAEQAGTSAPAVLYWFETREQLLTAALVADEEAFAAQVGERLAAVPGAADKLLLLIDATVAEPRIELWIELWARSLHDPDAARARQRRDEEWRGLLAATIAAGRDSGEFGADVDPERAALAIASLLDGLCVQMTLRDPALTPAAMRSIAIAHAETAIGTPLSAGRDIEAVGA